MLTILICDDSRPIELAIKKALAAYDITWLILKHYQDLAEVIKNSSPQISLIDMGLPGLEKIEDLITLREKTALAPMILMQGSYEKNTSFVQHPTLSLVQVLKKPFTKDELVQLIEKTLGKKLPKATQEQDKAHIRPIHHQEAEGHKEHAVHGASKGQIFDLFPWASFSKEQVKELLLTLVDQDDIKNFMVQAVEDYCRKNFKNIAKEVLSQELKKLAEDKSKEMFG